MLLLVMSITVSMTRANKLLSKLRDLSKNSPASTSSRRGIYYTSERASSKYGVETSYLTYNEKKLLDQLDLIRQEFIDKIDLVHLTERWKHMLFRLNIKYGIHEVLGKIDVLKIERSMLNAVLNSNTANCYQSADEVKSSYGRIADYAGKWDHKWSIGAFDSNTIRTKIADINKKLSFLDNEKDELNIRNSFTIKLSEKQCHLLSIELE